MTWRVLARAELAQHRSRYRMLVVVLALAVGSLLLVLALLNGVEGAVADELGSTVAGDARIARNSTGFAEGDLVDQEPITRLAGPADALHPRVEVQALYAPTDDLESWNAGLIVGVDVDEDRGMASRLVAGSFPSQTFVERDNRTLAPVVLGAGEAGRLGLEPGSRVNLTAGKTRIVDGEPRPIVRKGVVVGTFRTGLTVIDRYAVFTPIEHARYILDAHPAEQTATVVVAETDEPRPLVDRADAAGYEALTLSQFETQYLGTLFTALRGISYVIAAIAVLAVLAWVSHAITLLVLQDARKIATLRATGISTRTIRRTYLGVATAVGLAGAGLGIALGYGLAGLLNAASPHLPTLAGLRPRFEAGPLEAVGMGVVALAVAWIAAAVAVAYARRRDLTDALRV